MRINLVLLSFVLLTYSCNSTLKKEKETLSEKTTTTYFLIRHAEKDRSDPTNKDPELTKEGIERAQKWASYFEEISLDQVFSTDYRRTQQTAMYVAKDKNIDIAIYDPRDLYNEEFKSLTHGENILIVGHSNTTPQFVNAIIGEEKYTDIDDNENGILFMVSVEGESKNVQMFVVN